MKFLQISFILLCCCYANILPAQQHANDAQVQAVINNQVRGWMNDPLVIESIQKQNAQHMEWTAKEIEQANNQWQVERQQPKKPMIESLLDNDLSRYVLNVQENAQGLYLEIIVLDAKGCSVGQNNVTPSYWHGEDEKWKHLFSTGSSDVFIEETTKDTATQKWYIPAGIRIVDPASQQPIGAVLINFDIEKIVP